MYRLVVIIPAIIQLSSLLSFPFFNCFAQLTQKQSKWKTETVWLLYLDILFQLSEEF